MKWSRKVEERQVRREGGNDRGSEGRGKKVNERKIKGKESKAAMKERNQSINE